MVLSLTSLRRYPRGMTLCWQLKLLRKKKTKKQVGNIAGGKGKSCCNAMEMLNIVSLHPRTKEANVVLVPSLPLTLISSWYQDCVQQNTCTKCNSGKSPTEVTSSVNGPIHSFLGMFNIDGYLYSHLIDLNFLACLYFLWKKLYL